MKTSISGSKMDGFMKSGRAKWLLIALILAGLGFPAMADNEKDKKEHKDKSDHKSSPQGKHPAQSAVDLGHKSDSYSQSSAYFHYSAPPPKSVPDAGGTLALLSLAIGSLGLLGRKFRH